MLYAWIICKVLDLKVFFSEFEIKLHTGFLDNLSELWRSTEKHLHLSFSVFGNSTKDLKCQTKIIQNILYKEFYNFIIKLYGMIEEREGYNYRL